MATRHLSDVIQYLRRAALRGETVQLTDGQLLECFVRQGEEAALEALVRRHAVMVWNVCCRVLPGHQDAEDAFQATLLVLVRKAASIMPREMVGNWLYGVAYQTARKARATAAKRRSREKQVKEMPEPALMPAEVWSDLQPLLDQELNRLPDKYRVAVVLCDLEGKTRKEAARHLGLPEGTVASRLVRARIMLGKRLTQRGFALSGGALAAVLAQQAASAGVPNLLVESTIKGVCLLAAGKAAATGAISLKVAALTEGVMKAMLFTKLKAALAVVLILGFVATGATIFTWRAAAGQDDKKPAAEKPVDPIAKKEKQKDKESVTAWGKEVNGLQAGLGFRPGEQGVRNNWGMVTLVVRVRNVSMKDVTFQYCPESDWTLLPDVTDAKGKPIAVKGGFLPLNKSTKKVNLAPGKSIELWQWKLNLRPESESTKPPPDNPPYATLDGPGKLIIQYPWVVAWKLKPPDTWAKLGTGKLEIEVKSDPPQKQERKQQEGKEDAARFRLSAGPRAAPSSVGRGVVGYASG